MNCQKCQEKEATVYIAGTSTVHPRTGGGSRREDFALHFCASCAEEYQRAQPAHSLFPHLHEEPVTERLRVMSVTPERAILRLIRTEDAATPEDWTLLTSRLPKRLPVGEEITMTFTPTELKWMRGDREL